MLSDTVAVFFGRKTLPHWRTHPVNDHNGASAPPRSTATTTTNRGAHSTPHHPSYGGSNAHVEQKRSTSRRCKLRVHHLTQPSTDPPSLSQLRPLFSPNPSPPTLKRQKSGVLS